MVDSPRSLPHCAYPQAADVGWHGVQVLPPALPLVNFQQAAPYRSPQHRPVSAARLTQARHADPFGSHEPFGPWTKPQLLDWFIRLFILTAPASPRNAIRINEDALAHSLPILGRDGQVIGGAFNETMPGPDALTKHREDDPFLSAVWSFLAPCFGLLGAQDAEALHALCMHYPDFRAAQARKKVGHHFMAARSDALAKADTFELVAASAAHFQAWGHVRCARAWSREGMVTSRNGWLSDKDSGIMFYVLRLV